MGRRSARSPRRAIEAMWKTGGDSGERRETPRHERVGSVYVDPGRVENRKQVKWEAQGAQSK